MSNYPLLQFWTLLREAQASSEEVDEFDLVSWDAESERVFAKLIEEQRRDVLALVTYVVANAAALTEALNAPD